MAKRIAVIWIAIIVLYLLITLLFAPSIITGIVTQIPPSLPLAFLALAAIAMAFIFLRIIRAYGDAVLLAYETGQMGILIGGHDPCEECKKIQEDVEKEVRQIRRKIPWWNLIVLGAPAVTLAFTCVDFGIPTGPGVAICIAATLWLIGSLLELAAQSEAIVEKKNELQEKKKLLEKQHIT